MPQLVPVVLKDALNADHTFNPRGIVSGVATLAESNGVPIGNNQLTLSHIRTKGTAGRERVTFKVQVPVVQNVEVSGITRPTVVRTSYIDVTASFDPGSSTAERADAIAYTRNLLASAVGLAIMRDLEDAY